MSYIKYSIAILLSTICINSAVSNSQAVIHCNHDCKVELQKALDSDRSQHVVPGSENVGEQMSISLPDGKGGFQPIMNFYSGHATTDKKKLVGSITPGYRQKRIDLFNQASLTKAYVAVIILQLEQEHKLSLNDSLEKYFGEKYPDWNKVTIKQLLNMTSGIFDYQDSREFMTTWLQKPFHRWTPEELVQIAYHNKKPTLACQSGGNLCFQPGSSYLYSDTAYILAGMIIERISGHSLQYEMQHRLLGKYAKLGKLMNTYYLISYPESVKQRIIHGYGIQEPHIVGSMKQDYTQLNLNTVTAGGGVFSNTEDIVRWIRLLFQTNATLQPFTKKQLTQQVCQDRGSKFFGKPVSRIDASCNMGYGMGVQQIYDPAVGLSWFYEGGNPGYAAIYNLFKNTNIAIAIQRDSCVNVYFNQLEKSIIMILSKYKS